MWGELHINKARQACGGLGMSQCRLERFVPNAAAGPAVGTAACQRGEAMGAAVPGCSWPAAWHKRCGTQHACGCPSTHKAFVTLGVLHVRMQVGFATWMCT